MTPPPAAAPASAVPAPGGTVAWRPRTGDIPTAPGVYRFRDARGRVLYVGKAKNLRARVSNYFQPMRSLHERTRHMVLAASEVEWTVVGSEFEALQLEYTWIKEYAPPYNVRFRDDKSYPYLVVTLGDEAPRVMVSRTRRIPGARYFGPYPKAWAVRDTIELMVRAFPIRTCSDSNYARAMASGRPCFPSQIGRCGGPCSHRVSIEEHRATVDEFVAFLVSHDRRFVTEFTAKMRAAAAVQDYEAAARYRDRVHALENVLERSAVVLPDSADTDVFGIDHDELAAAVHQFVIRGGRVSGVRGWVVDKELDVSLGELVESALLGAYDETSPPPRQIVVPELPDDAAVLEELLGELRGRGSVRIRSARRGDKAAVLETATVNARGALALYKTKRTADYVARTQALGDLQAALGLAEAPLRIECFDVSHLQGTNIVASMVVFEDGLPRKNQYRSFGIAEYVDDTEAIYQVLSRRLARLDEDDDPDGADAVTSRPRFAYRPGLLVVDGGQPQVTAAARALADAGVDDIAVCGIAKRLEELWLPGSDYPVILPRNSEVLFLVQRLRDEAHRFAISLQRRRRKRDITTVLSEIPGLGPRRIAALLRHFGSVARLRSADAAQIQAVAGIGPELATAIVARLDSQPGGSERAT